MDSLFIDDGFTKTDHTPARPGLHPAVTATYRPALPRERLAYSAKLDSRDPEQIEAYQTDLITRHVLDLNGKKLDAAQARRLEPNVRARLVDLVLSYEPARAEQDAGN
jgi:hypothetical protein